MRTTVALLLLLLQLVAADLYAALGVSRDVDDRALKKAFRRKALQNHPDKQKAQSEEQKQAATEAFVAASNAFEVLSDPKKRKMYDQYGEEGLKASEHEAQQGGGFSGFRDPLEMFEDMFGSSGGFGGLGGFGHAFGSGDSNVFMDARGNVYMQAGSAGGGAQHQAPQYAHAQHAQHEQYARATQARARQEEQAARQAQFDSEARAHAEAQAARRSTKKADSRRRKGRRSEVLDL